MNRILLVEDEAPIREALALNLELEGYDVLACGDGSSALQLLQENHVDVAILDIMLPGMSGLELCTAIRLHHRELPILMLTARNAPEDRIAGLRTGADDYLTKPFHTEELLLRIANLVKRAEPPSEASSLDQFQFGPHFINFATYTAQTPSGTFSLTKKEAALLRLLIEKVNETVSRQQILQIVWGYDVVPSTRTIDNFILNFRKYFEVDPKHPRYFTSVRGVGYRFNLPAD